MLETSAENSFEETRVKSEELMEGREERVRGKMVFHAGYFVLEGPERQNPGEVRWTGSTESGLRMDTVTWRF